MTGAKHGTWARRFAALGALAAACGGSNREPQYVPSQVQCTVDGRIERRVTRDCSSTLTYQERDYGARLEALGGSLGGDADVAIRPVQSSIMVLIEQQRGMCRDWNACALSRREYVRRSDWMTVHFSTLVQLLSTVDPSGVQAGEARSALIRQVLEWADRAPSDGLPGRTQAIRGDVDRNQVNEPQVVDKAARDSATGDSIARDSATGDSATRD